jgi:hypothetical protein
MNLDNHSFEPNYLTHHLVLSTTFMLIASSSIGRAMQLFSFTIMLVASNAVFITTHAWQGLYEKGIDIST